MVAADVTYPIDATIIVEVNAEAVECGCIPIRCLAAAAALSAIEVCVPEVVRRSVDNEVVPCIVIYGRSYREVGARGAGIVEDLQIGRRREIDKSNAACKVPAYKD